MRSTTPLMLLLPLAVSAAPTCSSVNARATAGVKSTGQSTGQSTGKSTGNSTGNALLNELFCDVNAIVIGALHKDAAATTYCSSYLSIPTLTFTATATETPSSVYSTVPATVTGDAVTDTVTSTSTTTTNVTTTETSTQIVTETTTVTTATSTLTCLSSAYTASTPVGTILKRGVQASKPTCIPTTWASAVVSTACSCLSIPTPSTTTTVTQTLVPGTITVTSTNTLTPTDTATETTTSTATSTYTDTTTTTTTTTLTAYAEATTIASNSVSYRKYTHTYDADVTNNGFTSSTFKSLTPDWNGSIATLTFSTPNWSSGTEYLTLSDHSAFLATQAAIIVQGFFIAKQTGTYTLSSSKDYIDNWGYLWTGDAAYSSWSDSNTAFQASRTNAGYISGSVSLTLNAGDAIPIAWLWANGGGVGQSYFSITSPDGSSTTDTTGYLAQACSSDIFS